MAIIGMSECTIKIDRNSEIDQIINDIYSPSGGIINQLKTHQSSIDVLEKEISLKASKTELDTVKNKKYKARYLRFTLNGANSTTQNRWVEVQAYVGELNILQNLTPSSNKTIYNKTYATDGNIDNSKYTYTDGEGESYLQYDLGQVREDIDFIHLWHYSDGGNVIYNGVKVGLSEDGIEFANVFDSKYTGLYRESERGNLIPVNQGAVVEQMMSRIQKAEMKITPDAIASTVRDSMSNDFTNSENLLGEGSKINATNWSNNIANNFLFDNTNNFAMLNILDYSVGEIKYTYEEEIKIQPDTYHCFHFKVFQQKMLADQRFRITLTLNGGNLDLVEIFDGLVLSEIPDTPARLFKYTFKSSNKVQQTVKSVSIKIERRTTINTPATIVVKEPQFEMGAFPTQWTYPYNLGLKEFESHREQTAELIAERVTSKEFESYKSQTAREIAQIVKDTEGNFTTVNQKVDGVKTEVEKIGETIKNVQQEITPDGIFNKVSNSNKLNSSSEGNLLANTMPVNNRFWGAINGNVSFVTTDTELKIHIIDTKKQADAILIQENETNILIDCGYYSTATTVINYLKALNVDTIDLFIATHAHTDHIGATSEIIKRFKIKEAIYREANWELVDQIEPTGWGTSAAHREMLLAFNSNGINYREVKSLDVIKVSDNGELRLFNTTNEVYDEYNTRSIGVLYKHYNHKIFLASDMTTESEKHCAGEIGRVDVLKVGHHGANGSNSEMFIKELSPKYGLITTMDINHIDRKQALGSLQWGKVKMYDTGNNGTFVITSTKDSLIINGITQEYKMKNQWWHRRDVGEFREWVWFKEDGSVAKNEIINIGGGDYEFDENGICKNPD